MNTSKTARYLLTLALGSLLALSGLSIAAPPTDKPSKKTEAAQVPVVLDANGAVVGSLVEIKEGSSHPNTAWVMSSKGYVFSVSAFLGAIGEKRLMYDNATCSGVPEFLQLASAFYSIWSNTAVRGSVFQAENPELTPLTPAPLYYMPIDEEPQWLRLYILNDAGVCEPFSGGNVYAGRARENDSPTTDVEDSYFPAPVPLRIGISP